MVTPIRGRTAPWDFTHNIASKLNFTTMTQYYIKTAKACPP